MKIQSIKVTPGATTTIPYSRGDTWSVAWTREDELFSPVNDGYAFTDLATGNNPPERHVAIARLGFGLGGAPLLYGELVNDLPDYTPPPRDNILAARGPDGCTWKSSGCIAVDGALYLVIARHRYGEENPGDSLRRQSARDASIIKSADGGRTWTRAHDENYRRPMFPGARFATPYFVNYGRDGHETFADGGDEFVYAHANGGYWDNSDDLVLGRVLRKKIGALNVADWQFFTGGDGRAPSAWSPYLEAARPVLAEKTQLGSGGAVYLPQWQCYVLIGWHFPAGGGKLPGAVNETAWTFYAGDTPWGPWRAVGTHTFNPEGFYCPAICPRFMSADGRRAWVVTSGNWLNWRWYRLSFVGIELA
ncbi:MAG: DUF4185 domain-containing protein [Verrucomicrobiales bacterium]|jgi:hypothetical protein|nr:DUF4185 domain-containing protein [Verrucomicrobiales bacterium]